MLAQDKGNFHAHGKNRTRDPPVQWLERNVCVLLTSVSLKLSFRSPRARN